MGHRALIIIEQEDRRGVFNIRSSHWGAYNAQYLGTSYSDMKQVGKSEKVAYDTLSHAVSKRIDFLFHEAVYLARPNRPTKAFDTVWWRGAQEYVPSPGGCVGVGALVQLKDSDEWEEWASSAYGAKTDSMSADEFHKFIQESDFADRVPDWSPLGGNEILVDERYRD